MQRLSKQLDTDGEPASLQPTNREKQRMQEIGLKCEGGAALAKLPPTGKSGTSKLGRVKKSTKSYERLSGIRTNERVAENVEKAAVNRKAILKKRVTELHDSKKAVSMLIERAEASGSQTEETSI